MAHMPVKDKKMACRDTISTLSSLGKVWLYFLSYSRNYNIYPGDCWKSTLRKLEYTPAQDEKKACTRNSSSISSSRKVLWISFLLYLKWLPIFSRILLLNVKICQLLTCSMTILHRYGMLESVCTSFVYSVH